MGSSSGGIIFIYIYIVVLSSRYRINKKMVTRYYRDMFLSMDSWIDMSLEELVVLEAECKMMLPIHMDKVK